MIDREHAEGLDARDALAGFRERFLFADDATYLDGNSLGRLPLATAGRLAHVTEVEWGRRLIGSWGEGWLDLPITIGDAIGAAAIGAAAGQVAVGDSTTVCLYKLASAALDARPGPERDRHRRPQLPDRPVHLRRARPGARVDGPLGRV